jgi:hypothetical protein
MTPAGGVRVSSTTPSFVILGLDPRTQLPVNGRTGEAGETPGPCNLALPPPCGEGRRQQRVGVC